MSWLGLVVALVIRLYSIRIINYCTVKVKSDLRLSEPNWNRDVVKRRHHTIGDAVLYFFSLEGMHRASSVAALHQGAPGQMTWLEDPSTWLRPPYCFASVIVRTENKKCYRVWSLYLSLTVKQAAALAACVLMATTKKVVNFFEEKKCIPRENLGYAPDSGWPGLRIFWPRNDLATLLRWRHHCASPSSSLLIHVK